MENLPKRFKGYLRYKNITSQNVSSEAQVKKVNFSSQDIQVFCIYQICEVMITVSTSDRVYFWIYLLNHNLLSHQTCPIDCYNQRQTFSGTLWRIWSTGAKFQVLFNLATCSNYSITKYVKIHFFEKMNKG